MTDPTEIRVTTWALRRDGLHIFIDGKQVARIHFDKLTSLLVDICTALKNRPEI